MKTCAKCKEAKALESFSNNRATKDGLNIYCRTCHAELTAEYKRSHPEATKLSAKASRDKRKDKEWSRSIERNYGCTETMYNEMFQNQEGKCLGCETHQSELKHRLCVDHNHRTDAIRGLLCKGCNVALGRVSDSPKTLRRLADYLERAD